MENLMKKLYATIDEKNVRNKKLIDGIYDVVNVDKKKNSAFADMPAKTKKADFFYEKYIESITDFKEFSDMSTDFDMAIEEARRISFKIGFQTALKLILESEGRAMPFICSEGFAECNSEAETA